MHLSEGQLRAHFDGQLDGVGQEHLAACPNCRTRLAAVVSRSEQVQAHLSALAPLPSEAHRRQQVAYTQLAARRQRLTVADRKGLQMDKLLFSRRARPVWASLMAVAALAFAFSFAPVRAWAGQFLGLFRVEQIAVLPIDTTRLSELSQDSTLAEQIGQMFADSVTVTNQPGEPQAVADAAQAGRMAGFTVRLVADGDTPSHITVQDGTAFEFVVDRDRAQALLDDSGRSDLRLPASLDGATIKVEIPAAVSAAYGECPTHMSEAERESASWERLRACVLLAQVPSPTVTAPPDLDLLQLIEIGLQFAGMTPDEARAFGQTVDWTSTLVVPIPRNAASYEQVAVDGVMGTLIERLADDGVPRHYVLMWVKDGIIYALSGFGSPDQALAMGNALK